jgi:hypothetical protein
MVMSQKIKIKTVISKAQKNKKTPLNKVNNTYLTLINNAMSKKYYTRIFYKESWGFWIFKRYSFYIQDKDESITEVHVDKSTWGAYNIGDYYIRYEDKKSSRI